MTHSGIVESMLPSIRKCHFNYATVVVVPGVRVVFIETRFFILSQKISCFLFAVSALVIWE